MSLMCTGYVSLTNANWDGAEVVEKSGHNIVIVNFNYRVGLWGFLASDTLRHDGDLNVGLLDQRMLLHWVKKHISQFGGDPDHVVIHGASAGAGSVALHMVAYGGRDDKLFVGAIAESIFFPAQPYVPELEWQFSRVLNQTGCDDLLPVNQMACLRSKDAAALQAANFAQPFPGRPEWPSPLFYWTPCIDGVFLRGLPYSQFAGGRFVDVPVLFGTDTNGKFPSLTPKSRDMPTHSKQRAPSSPSTPEANKTWPTSSQTTTPNSPPTTPTPSLPSTPHPQTNPLPHFPTTPHGIPPPARPTVKLPLSVPTTTSSTSSAPVAVSRTATTYKTRAIRSRGSACRICSKQQPSLGQTTSATPVHRIRRTTHLSCPWSCRISSASCGRSTQTCIVPRGRRVPSGTPGMRAGWRGLYWRLDGRGWKGHPLMNGYAVVFGWSWVRFWNSDGDDIHHCLAQGIVPRI